MIEAKRQEVVSTHGEEWGAKLKVRPRPLVRRRQAGILRSRRSALHAVDVRAPLPVGNGLPGRRRPGAHLGDQRGDACLPPRLPPRLAD